MKQVEIFQIILSSRLPEGGGSQSQKSYSSQFGLDYEIWKLVRRKIDENPVFIVDHDT